MSSQDLAIWDDAVGFYDTLIDSGSFKSGVGGTVNDQGKVSIVLGAKWNDGDAITVAAGATLDVYGTLTEAIGGNLDDFGTLIIEPGAALDIFGMVTVEPVATYEPLGTVTVEPGGTLTIPGQATPVIVVSTSLLNLGTTTQGTAGSGQSYTVSGSNLTADILLTAPTGVELSDNGGTSYSTTLDLAESGHGRHDHHSAELYPHLIIDRSTHSN